MSDPSITKAIIPFTLSTFQDDPSGIIILSLRDFLHKYSGILGYPHRIDYFQLILLDKGYGQICIDTKDSDINDFNLIALSPGQIIKLNLYNKSIGYTIIFSSEFINRFIGDIAWIFNLSLFLQPSPQGIMELSPAEYSLTKDLFEKLFLEYNAKDDFAKNEILINMLKTLLLHLERCKRSSSVEAANIPDSISQFRSFQKLLEENFNQTRSVQFYADKLNITSKKLNIITTDQTDKSAKQVIEERMLLEIKRLLLHTDLSVREIGSAVGFTDPANFSKFFRRYLNDSPAAFRLSKKSLLYHKKAGIDN
jgi:AraC-like DNA-binding protein